jgi:hypothetical protein
VGGGRKAVSCQCGDPALEEVRSEAGAVIATICRRCTLPLTADCPVCRKPFRDLAAHFRLSECGGFYRKGMVWSRRRPPNAPIPGDQP